MNDEQVATLVNIAREVMEETRVEDEREPYSPWANDYLDGARGMLSRVVCDLGIAEEKVTNAGWGRFTSSRDTLQAFVDDYSNVEQKKPNKHTHPYWYCKQCGFTPDWCIHRTEEGPIE